MYRSEGLAIARCGSLETIGLPVGDIFGPTTQLLLPGSVTASTGSVRRDCVGALFLKRSISSGRGSRSDTAVAAKTASLTSDTSSPFGRCKSSQGSGAARLFASATPYLATFI